MTIKERSEAQHLTITKINYCLSLMIHAQVMPLDRSLSVA